MRILYYLAHPGGLGGASNQMLTQAHIMTMAGHEVRVIIQNDENGTHNPDFDRICDLFGLEKDEDCFSISTCIENIDILDSIDKVECIAGQINEFKPDLVHSLQINTTVELACRQLGIPHVMSIYPLAEGMFNLKWEDVFPRFVVGDCLYFTEKWSNGLRARGRCIRVCYLKNENYRKELRANLDCELLCIGVFATYKNQLEIIKFVNRLIMEGVGVHLSFLGDYSTDYGRECIEYVSEHNLNKHIDFKGFVLDVDRYFEKADAIIHASVKESFPGVLVEAMANRTPIIAFPAGGIIELMKDGDNGILLDGSTEESIYRAYKRLVDLRSNGGIRHLVDNAYETYLKSHSREVVLAQLVEFYSEILAEWSYTDRRINERPINGLLCDSLLTEHECSEFTRKHLWYLWHIKRLVVQEGYKTARIWGAGLIGRYAVEWCKLLGIKPLGFVDSYKTGEYLGLPILKPDRDDAFSSDIILVAISNIDICRNIQYRIEAKGLIRNKRSFFLINDPCM